MQRPCECYRIYIASWKNGKGRKNKTPGGEKEEAFGGRHGPTVQLRVRIRAGLGGEVRGNRLRESIQEKKRTPRTMSSAAGIVVSATIQGNLWNEVLKVSGYGRGGEGFLSRLVPPSMGDNLLGWHVVSPH